MNMAKKAPVGQVAAPTQTDQASATGSSIAYSADHLANQFLIAMPGMVDPNFAGSVIYLFEHTERGAMGLVINRPTELDMGALFEKIEVKLEVDPVSEQRV
jgi:putative transcriptional regulator